MMEPLCERQTKSKETQNPWGTGKHSKKGTLGTLSKVWVGKA